MGAGRALLDAAAAAVARERPTVVSCFAPQLPEAECCYRQYLQNKVYAYDEAGAPMLGPPRKGVWRSNQVVYTALNVTAAGPDDAPLGWRCVEGGRPGRWVPVGGK